MLNERLIREQGKIVEKGNATPPPLSPRMSTGAIEEEAAAVMIRSFLILDRK
jgi:hypothetical protein